MADPPHYTPRDLPNTARGLASSIDLPNTTSSTGQPAASEKQTEIDDISELQRIVKHVVTEKGVFTDQDISRIILHLTNIVAVVAQGQGRILNLNAWSQESARSISDLELALLSDNFAVDNILYRHLINSAMWAIYDALCAAFMQTAYGVLQYEALARKCSMKGVMEGSLRFYAKYNAVVRPEYKISSSDHLDILLRKFLGAQQVELKQNDDETACKGVQQLIAIYKNQKRMCVAKLEAEKKLSEELKVHKEQLIRLRNYEYFIGVAQYLVWDEQVMKLLQSKDVEISTNLGNCAAHPDNCHSRALAAVDRLSLRLDVDEASRTVVRKIGYILVKSKEKPDTLREHEFDPDTIEDNCYYARENALGVFTYSKGHKLMFYDGTTAAGKRKHDLGLQIDVMSNFDPNHGSSIVSQPTAPEIPTVSETTPTVPKTPTGPETPTVSDTSTVIEMPPVSAQLPTSPPSPILPVSPVPTSPPPTSGPSSGIHFTPSPAGSISPSPAVSLFFLDPMVQPDETPMAFFGSGVYGMA
ncbi:hypothetical protein ACEPAI_3997 [Sanghuangporus weigelae]